MLVRHLSKFFSRAETDSPPTVVGPALFYGGLSQFMAGMVRHSILLYFLQNEGCEYRVGGKLVINSS